MPGATRGWNVGQPVPLRQHEQLHAGLHHLLDGWASGAPTPTPAEKMPWLMIHIVQPSVFVAALFLGADR